MKSLVSLVLSLLASHAFAGFSTLPNRVPEPEMWALLGVAVAAVGAARYLRGRNRTPRQ